MDKMRQRHVDEIERLKDAISRTESKQLKNDYVKSLKRMQNELKEYDRYKGGE